MDDLFGPVVIRGGFHKSEERICPQCNQKYMTVHGSQKYCGWNCRCDKNKEYLRNYRRAKRKIVAIAAE